MQMIDNIHQQSHNLLQQPRNPHSRYTRFTSILGDFSRITAHILAIDTAAYCSEIKLATCSPAFDGENHITDRQYTPAV
jgi:hypothetical protein